MKWNIQIDSRWKDDIMTQSDDWIDTLGKYGDLVTCLANIIQFIADKNITPKDINQVIKDLKAYKYLENQNVSKGQASLIIWPKLIRFYRDSIDFKLKININEYKNEFDYFYIARIKNSFNRDSTYINVFSKSKSNFWCFDVADGQLKAYPFEEIIYLHQLKRKWS